MRKKRVYKVQECFEFVCPELWDGLERTKDKKIRYCGECSKNVYKATTKEKMFELGQEGKCVAFFDYVYETIGKISDPTFDEDLPKF